MVAVLVASNRREEVQLYFFTMKRINKKFFTLSVLFLSAISTYAQYDGDAYYRIENVGVDQCLYIVSDFILDVDYSKAGVDLPNIRGVYKKQDQYSKPSTIFYLKKTGTGSKGTIIIDVASQGVSVSSLTGGENVKIRPASTANAYYAYATHSGVTKYLSCVKNQPSFGKYDDCYVKTADFGETGTKAEFYLKKIDTNTNYFGINPRVEFNGEFYDPFYVAFPFKMPADMTAYAIINIAKASDGKTYAVYKEVNNVIKEGTPLIIKCASSKPEDNKLTINGVSPTALPCSNLLGGVYRCCELETVPDYVKYDASTMRILGTTSEGKLGFITASYTTVPVNTAYLKVPAGTAKELTLISQEDYNKTVSGIDDITVDEQTINPRVKGVYNLSGVRVADTSDFNSLPKGVYIVDGHQKLK